MFSKKLHADVKKSTLKIQDPKKDYATRFKHLRVILEHVDVDEAKDIFEKNYHHIFYVFYDTFINAEANLKQKVHKAHREELEAVLNVLDKIIILLPELLSKRWQCHSLMRLLSKLLHPGNSHKLRKEAMRYFLMWYQILGDNCPDEVHAMYATLVPGFSSPFEEHLGINGLLPHASAAVFHDTSHGPVSPVDIQPIYPPQSGEKQPDDLMRFFIDALLEFSVTQVSRIEWKEKAVKHVKCFTFLFDRFKQYYLPIIFPNFSSKTDLYKPFLEIPVLRKRSVDKSTEGDQFLNCRVVVIKWIANFTHLTKAHPIPIIGRSASVTPSESEGERSPGTDLRRVSVGQAGCYDSAISTFVPLTDVNSSEDPNITAFQIVREVLYSSRENVNFIHEIYRQAFLLDFTHSLAVRRAITVYKDWIQMNVTELPPFMLEPPDPQRSGPSSSDFGSAESYDDSGKFYRQRNDSSMSSISKENIIIRAGLQNFLQVFITDACNVFLLELQPDVPLLLEEQVDICKRVLNVYRYMVMHTNMESRTWEQLLVVLLHVTTIILNTSPPKKKEETLGGRLAPAIFQTLIVTWIKANLNVMISSELWDQFSSVISSLTQWEELIREWTKTMETLTRVLAKHVYGLDLTDLPLDRLSEQKAKRQRKGVGIKNDKSENLQQADNEPSAKTSELVSDNTEIQEKDTLPCSPLRRCVSEGNLLRQHGISTQINSENPVNISGLSQELECEIEKIISSGPSRRSLNKLGRKWRSMDSFRGYNMYCDSECATRTPSPAPSSGVESNSFKESPMQIDVISNESGVVDSHDGRSVMSGGCLRGWLPDVASVLWLRMLGALGDVNKIQDPSLHAQVFHFLVDLFNTLSKIRLNQGIPCENQGATSDPHIVPPLTIFSPWCFQALNLPEQFHRGKLCAYKLLCSMTVCNQDVPLHIKHLSLFYSTLHQGLLSGDQAVVNTIIRNCGPRFFSLQLPGFSILLLDFIYAAKNIVSSSEVRGTPRAEAVSILGSVLSFPSDLSKLAMLEPTPNTFSVKYFPDLRDKVLNIILKAGKTEISGIARCIALSNLGIFLHQELNLRKKHPKVMESVNTLLLALRFNHKTVAQTACDIILFLCDHAVTLQDLYPEIPPRIIEVLVGTLSYMMPVGDSDKRLLTSLVFCLGEWTMNVPFEHLVQSQNGVSLMKNIFQVLDDLSEGGNGRNIQVSPFHPDLLQEFNPNITVDDLKLQDLPPGRRTAFPPSPSSPAHLNSTAHSIQLAAKLVISHLVNNLGHFPLTSGGAHLGSLVVEQDDVVGLTSDQLSSQLFTAPNIQVFVTSQQQIISLVEIPVLDVPGGGVVDTLVSAPSQVRVIIRDLTGKASWDASILYCSQEQCPAADAYQSFSIDQINSNSMLSSLCAVSLSQHTLRHRSPDVLPTFENSAEDLDNLDDLLQYIGHTSPEVLENLDSPRNMPAASFNIELEQEAMSSILGMRTTQSDYVSRTNEPVIGVVPIRCKDVDDKTPFQYCRLLFSQFGMHSWDFRSLLYLVEKNDKLLREMRNLDSQRCRQTHKVAIIYVAQGQEDKSSILSNSGGSQAYEDFISGLAWEVELETHMGFMGGLQRNKVTGVTAPYFATSFTEVIFHVSTRMPSNTAEALLQKTRHLGNDEVHIVWSEHMRDYRRGIIPTEFCDVLIVIYPIPNQLYRIQVSRKPDVPYFGPLYNEAIVSHKELPGLIRATALSASRAKRSMLPFYQQFYEERARSLEVVIKNHKKSSTFEEFAANVFSPVQLQSESSDSTKSAGGSCIQSTDDGSTSSIGSSSSSTLAALLDPTGSKVSFSSQSADEHKNWLHESDSHTHHGISPRPLKKLVMKPAHWRNPQPSLSPPDSPTLRRSK